MCAFFSPSSINLGTYISLSEVFDDDERDYDWFYFLQRIGLNQFLSDTSIGEMASLEVLHIHIYLPFNYFYFHIYILYHVMR